MYHSTQRSGKNILRKMIRGSKLGPYVVSQVVTTLTEGIQRILETRFISQRPAQQILNISSGSLPSCLMGLLTSRAFQAVCTSTEGTKGLPGDGIHVGLSDLTAEKAGTSGYFKWRVQEHVFNGATKYSIQSVSSELYLDGRDSNHTGRQLYLTGRKPEGDKYLMWDLEYPTEKLVAKGFRIPTLT